MVKSKAKRKAPEASPDVSMIDSPNNNVDAEADKTDKTDKTGEFYVDRYDIHVQSGEFDAHRINRFKALGSEVVTVLVGPQERKFVVHEGLLSLLSKFFRGALRGRFSESEDLTVRLPEHMPAVFDRFIQWLYRDQDNIDDRFLVYDGSFIRRANTIEQVDLFNLADFLGCERLKRHINKYMTDGKKPSEQSVPTAETVSYVWEHAPLESEFRHVVTRAFVRHAHVGIFDPELEYPTEFWLAVASEQKRQMEEAGFSTK